MDFVIALLTFLLRYKLTFNNLVVKNQFGIDYVALFADFPYIKGNADGVKVVRFFDFAIKKIPHLK